MARRMLTLALSALYESTERVFTLEAENERLRAALNYAAGWISTTPSWSHKHPDEILRYLLSRKWRDDALGDQE